MSIRSSAVPNKPAMPNLATREAFGSDTIATMNDAVAISAADHITTNQTDENSRGAGPLSCAWTGMPAPYRPCFGVREMLLVCRALHAWPTRMSWLMPLRGWLTIRNWR